jgi:predicted RNA-binding Zn ribbon-like protein
MSSPSQVNCNHELIIAFLNTAVPDSARREDPFITDESVLRWLEEQGLFRPGTVDCSPLEGLAVHARTLREVVRELMNQRKEEGEVEVVRLNRFLKAARYTIELIETGEGEVEFVRRFAFGSARQVLSPVALAAADLLANGDFRLLKKCEGERCMTWFYDGTKARRRRWCDTEICANRGKGTPVESKAEVK